MEGDLTKDEKKKTTEPTEGEKTETTKDKTGGSVCPIEEKSTEITEEKTGKAFYPKVTSLSYLKKILKEKNLHPRRSLGQHFLIDENILEKIIAAASLQKEDLVIDIGAGPGALSLAMAPAVAGVLAVEQDAGLAAVLREQASLRGLDNLYVVQGDIRRLPLGEICQENFKGLPSIPSSPALFPGDPFAGAAPAEVKVVANLPYYLITPLLFKLLQGKEVKIKLLVLMVQLEVAQRITALPGGKQYGLLSVLCRYYTRPQLLFKVSRHVFFPPPEVDSAVVALSVYDTPPFKVKDELFFWQIVRAAFQQRRKTILNALNGVGGAGREAWEMLLLEAGIDPLRRGETLSLEEFANLCEIFYNKKGF